MLDQNSEKEIKRFAVQIRMEIVKMISRLSAGHLGGALSIADALAVLYSGQLRHDPKNPHWSERDWLVLSKGHCGPALYATLALRGFFPMEMLETLNAPHTNLPSHCDRLRTPGIDMTTGSLGQGASTAAGVAVGLKMDGAPNKVFVIFGDGEIQEGQVWEMAMFAASRHLDNLIALVDYNKLQIDGRTDNDEVCCVGDIAAKFTAFGWDSQFVNGHDVAEIDRAIDHAKAHTGSPSAIVLDTVKGKGWSRSENQVGSHSRGLKPEELAEALAELQAELARI
ncbi:MAG: transketolase [Oscillospiraceae bacterium]|nr:transketolase [Oscillospiraceae bacterium]MCC8156019.1 transketolase [Oscillospiraceae bacterium]MCD7903871.1 transketolase [Oscillospiraceae bacterium]MCD8001024.1 transketolase [Oscillospiraceae bacterium]MCD8240545.1 transketolase [Oscillospiraceae bacterium]